jgi:tryptophan-rich sensory protein
MSSQTTTFYPLANVGGPPTPLASYPASQTVVTEETTTTTTTKEVDVATDTTMHQFKQAACSKNLWMFLLIAIIVLIICYFIAAPNAVWFDSLKKFSWGNNSLIFFIVLVIVVLVMAGGTYVAYSVANTYMQGAILMSFMAAMFLLIIWFAIFYQAQQLDHAFYIGMVFLFVAFIQTYLVFQASVKAGYAMLPYIIWMVLVVLMVYKIFVDNVVN